MADTIAIPRQAHRDVSPTFGNRNSPSQIANDSGDLAGAARRDINEMLGKIDEYDVDGRCKKAYKRAAKKVMKMTNDDFDKFLKEIIKKNR